MTYEVINAVRSKSLVRVNGGVANTHVNLSMLAASTAETVTNASIAQVSSTSNGIWRVYRGNSGAGELILDLPTFSNFVLYEYDIVFSNTSSANLFIEHTGSSGTLILQLGKTATYSTDIGKL